MCGARETSELLELGNNKICMRQKRFSSEMAMEQGLRLWMRENDILWQLTHLDQCMFVETTSTDN